MNSKHVQIEITDGGYEVCGQQFCGSSLLLLVGDLLNSYGFAIITVTILLRLIVMPITAKTASQSKI